MKPRLGLSAASFLLAIAIHATSAQETGRITGRVTDVRLHPIEGAVVSVVGGVPTSTHTNNSGAFRLESVTGPVVRLRVQRVGYEPRTVEARVGDADVRVILAELTINLNAVVVTGTAGATELRAVGNAISQVKAADIAETAPVRDVGQLLNGRAAGVAITPPGGLSGGGSRILIRGRSSFSLSTDPIVYVDGVRVNGDGPTGGNGVNATSRINDFNPDDIESIEIIKGPAAATLYGTEASNGVIQIITKRGRPGPARFDVSTRQGTTWFQNYQGRWLTSYYKDPVTGERPGFNLAQVESDAGRPLFHNGYQQGYQASLNGGSEAIQYYASGNYDKDEGVQPHDASNRFGSRLNLTTHPTSSVDLSGDFGLSLARNNLADGGSLMFNALLTRPLNQSTPTRGFYQAPSEVWARTTFVDQNVDRFTGSVDLAQRPATWFNQRLRTGLDLSTIDNITLVRHMSPADAKFFSATSAAGSKTINESGVFNATVDYNANVVRTVRALVTTTTGGFQYFRRDTRLLSATGNQFPSADITSIAGAAQRLGSDDRVQNITVGGYAQEQIAWRERVYLTGAIRFDRNSAFGAAFKSVAYPKVSASWVVSDEPWWHLGLVDAFRLRGAFGASGQQPQAFAALQTYQAVTGQAGAPAVSPQFIGNPNLGPERSQELELGFESSLINKRIGVDFTWYNKTTSDAIVLRDIAPSSGFPQQQYVNLGKVGNRGLELAVTTRPVETRAATWDLGFNVSTNDNKLIDLGLPNTKYLEFGYGNRFQPGFPLYAEFARKVVSADRGPDGKPINIKCDGGTADYRAGGTPVDCATAPRIYVGRPDPNVQGSISSSVTVARRLTFTGLVDFKHGNRIWSSSQWCPGILGCYEKLYPEKVSPVEAAHSILGYTDDAEWWKDVSFAKLRELSVNYVVPDVWAQRLGRAKRASISVAARNLHTWTSYKGLDPESAYAFPATGGTNFEQNELPQLQTFMVRLNLSY